MKVKELIRMLKKYDQETNVEVCAPNGLMFPPVVKLNLKDKYDVLNHRPDNVESYVITY